jgi:hypothetical protein
MFPALLAHHQEAIHIQQLKYCVRIMSASCYQAVAADDEQVVLKTCRDCQFAINLKQKVHLVGPSIVIYYDARSTKH